MRTPSLVLLGAAAGVAFALAATEPSVVFTGADARPAPAAKKIHLLELFVGAFDRVRTNYVDKTEDSQLVHSAIDGMLSRLEDSSFVDAKALQRKACAASDCPAAYGGVGIDVTVVDGLAEVISPIDDSPAARAGVMARDVIAEIDDQPIENMPLNLVADKLAGPPGKKIHLKLVRPGRDNPVDVTFARGEIPSQSVRARSEGGDLGYIRINQFNDATSDELKAAFDDIAGHIKPERLRGYVLDLRNNPGGSFDQAVAVADAFLDDGEIVSIRGRRASAKERFVAKPGDLAGGKPLAVLINAGSASAAEIVAGALKDNHRATIVGTRSFGKGGAVSLIPVSGGLGALRLTTGHYFTPSGGSIAGNGIAPDIEARQDLPADLRPDAEWKAKDQAAFQSYIPPDPKSDRALASAFDLLRSPKTAN